MGMDRKKTEIQKIKNGYIELCRFVFCIMIVIHHTVRDVDTGTILPGGFVAVNFFFFVSGAMAVRHLEREKQEIPEKMRYAMEYTLRKIKRIFPYAACGTLFSYLWRFLTVRSLCMPMLQELAILPCELLFLPMTGIVPLTAGYYRNASLWYVSAMFITLPLIIYWYLKSKDVFKYYIVWFVPFLIHGWMILHMGASWGWGSTTPIGFSALLVSFSNLLLGGTCYFVAEYLKKREFGRIAKILLTVLEVGVVFLCFGFAVTLPDTYVYETVTGFLAASVAVTLSGVSYTGKLRGRFWEWLGKLSMPVYCVHGWIIQLVQNYLGWYSYPMKILFILVGSITLSLILLFVVENKERLIRRIHYENI